jgi:arsenite-transporting ATPase
MAKLMLFTGKGGVGKSTVSAATAYHWANEGYKTLLISSDPAHSTQDILGTPVGFTKTLIKENLWAKNINSQVKAQEFFNDLQGALSTTFTKMLPGFDMELLTDWARFPGMDEVFALEELLYLVQGVEYDIIIFDTAPTGHTLRALNAPDALNSFILRILRMKSRIEKMKSIFLKTEEDVSDLVKIINKMNKILNSLKELLRNEDFININLVTIPTEAGYQECYRTIQYLESQGFNIKNLVVNNIIPSFDEKTWSEAPNNKAVALLKTEKDIQKDYISLYSTLTEEEGINLIGVSKLPFQPIGTKLTEFAKFLTGLDFVPEKAINVEESKDKVVVKLYFPNSKRVKLKEKSYFIDYREYPIDLPSNVENLKVRKVRHERGATYIYKR